MLLGRAGHISPSASRGRSSWFLSWFPPIITSGVDDHPPSPAALGITHHPLLTVTMNAAGGIWAPAAMRAVRIAVSRAGKVLRARVARPVQSALEPVLEPVVARGTRPRQPIHPVAFLRQLRNRSIHSKASSSSSSPASARRQFSTSPPRPDNAKFLKTQVGQAVSSFAGRAPFASALRPNLTGGALPRSAGGYGLGSGGVGAARFFSHGPASGAQVIQNVSQAVRAFCISGQKAQFDGLNARGDARFRAVSAVQDQTIRKLSAMSATMLHQGTDSAPGSSLDFRLNPTVTALGPLAAAFPFPTATAMSTAEPSINTEGFLDVLSGDFARSLKDLTATLADLQKLAVLGDLPVKLVEAKGGHILRVRFPGVDADTVEALCLDLGLTRGLVTEDAEFSRNVPVALKFPFASTLLSSQDQLIDMKLNTGRNFDRAAYLFDADETESDTDEEEIAAMFFDEYAHDNLLDDEDLDDGFSEIVQRNPWLASPSSSGSSSLPSFHAVDSALLDGAYDDVTAGRSLRDSRSSRRCRLDESVNSSSNFEGVEGVHRFLEECDRARGRL